MKTTCERLVRKLKQSRVDAVAISLLFSFLHPEHEERIASALAELDVPLVDLKSHSSRVSRVRTDLDRRHQCVPATIDGPVFETTVMQQPGQNNGSISA